MHNENNYPGKEWALLELTALVFNGSLEPEALKSFLSGNSIDWGEVIRQGMRQRMLPLLSYVLTLEEIFDLIPPYLVELFTASLGLNKHIARIQDQEAAVVIKAFNDAAINFVNTKGIVFDKTIYRSLGVRKSGDIDFMVEPKYKKEVELILRELGALPGHYDAKLKKILGLDEKYVRLYNLTPAQMPHHVKPVKDFLVQAVDIDINFELTWFGSPYKVPTEEALKEKVWVSVPGERDIKIPSFSIAYQFLYTILHLFKEAWVESYRLLDDEGGDVALQQFLDVFMLFTAYRQELLRSNFHRIVMRYDLVKPTLWVLGHTEQLFAVQMVKDLGFKEDVSPGWLCSWQSPGGKIGQWKGTMRERLKAKNCKPLFINNFSIR